MSQQQLQPPPAVAPQRQINVNRLNELKIRIDKLAEEKKVIKGEATQIEAQCIAALVQMGKRYIDESNNGAGPFYSLSKVKSDGSFNQERYLEFFSSLIAEFKAGKNYTPQQCYELTQVYLKQFEKRKLGLTKLNQVRRKDIEDLKLWLNGGDA